MEIALLLNEGSDELGDLAAVAPCAGWSSQASLQWVRGQLALRIRAVAPSPGLDAVQMAAVFEGSQWRIDSQSTGSVSEEGAVEPKDVDTLLSDVLRCVPAYLVPSHTTDPMFVDLSAGAGDDALLDRLCDQLQEPCGLYVWGLAMGWEMSVTHAVTDGLPEVRIAGRLPRQIDERLLVAPAEGENPLVPGAINSSWLLHNDGWVLNSEAAGFAGASGRIACGDLDEFVWVMALGAPDSVLDSTVMATRWHSEGASIPTSSLPVTPLKAEDSPSSDVVGARLEMIADWAGVSGFSERLSPTRAAVARYLKDRHHGTEGYYVLEFSDGQCYVGESVNLPVRLDQHRARYSDLQGVRIRSDDIPRRVPDVKRHLRIQERIFIHAAQNVGLLARNINEMATMIGASKHLDRIVSPVEQEKWLSAPDSTNASDLAGRRAYSEERLASSTVNFRQFVTLPDADQITRIIGQYLARCVPYPARTEYQSWALSCLTKPGWKRGRLSCITIAMTETLTLFYDGGSASPGGKVQVNDAELFPTEYSELAFSRRHPTIRIVPAEYEESGPGQSFLYAYSLDDLERLLDDVAVTRAAATTALHIMRKGPCMQRKVHSPQLTEAAFRYVPSTAVSSALTH